MADASYPARLTSAKQQTFHVQLANLTHNAVFVATDSPLSFRERVKLAIGELTLEAEVVFSVPQPKGVIVSFPSDTNVTRVLETIFDKVASIQGPADEPWDDETEQGAEDEVAQATAAATDAAAAESPLNVTQETPAVPKPDPFASATPTPFAMLAGETSQEDPTTALPELDPDGTLRFLSATSFAFQFESNLTHGGIVARSSALPIGSQKILKFQIPGISERMELSARVGFVGDGTVGFMIDSFAVHRAKLESMLQQLA